MTPGLKAGLVGAAVLVVLDLLGIIPCVGVCACLLGLVAYAGVGALAAYWTPPPREAGPAAGQGALAAILAALVSGVVNMVILTVQATVMGPERILSQIPPEALRQLQQAGMDPELFRSMAGPVGGVVGGGLCCGGGIVLAAILGAIGGAVYAGIKPE